MNRDKALRSLRPEIPAAQVDKHTSPEERFQNETLRPILKLQNDILAQAFQQQLQKYKVPFDDFTKEKQTAYIQKAIQKDLKFRNMLKGMIVGHLTIAEYEFYTQHESALDKRLMSMLAQRLES